MAANLHRKVDLLKQRVGGDSQNKYILVATKAHCTVVCCVCDKPRVVYSLSQFQFNNPDYQTDNLYPCGSTLPIAFDSEEHRDSPVVRQGIYCKQ